MVTPQQCLCTSFAPYVCAFELSTYILVCKISEVCLPHINAENPFKKRDKDKDNSFSNPIYI